MKENYELREPSKRKWTIHLKINENLFWILWWLIIVTGVVICQGIKC